MERHEINEDTIERFISEFKTSFLQKIDAIRSKEKFVEKAEKVPPSFDQTEDTALLLERKENALNQLFKGTIFSLRLKFDKELQKEESGEPLLQKDYIALNAFRTLYFFVLESAILIYDPKQIKDLLYYASLELHNLSQKEAYNQWKNYSSVSKSLVKTLKDSKIKN